MYFRLKSDPLVSHGRHFGRTVFALCNYPSLLTNGILRLEQLEEASLEDFTAEERREHLVFEKLLDSYPGLLERIRDGTEEEVLHVGELCLASRLVRGHPLARGEDTKSLKPVVIDWIIPAGEAVVPSLPRNSKISRGFNHPITGHLLCPAELDWNDTDRSCKAVKLAVSGDQWPLFWKKSLRLRSAGNARLHGMTAVTAPSVTYVATQVRFALCSSSVFSRTDTVTDSETFYHSLLDLLEDPDEKEEVTDLLVWWNRQIFPTSSAARRTLKTNSALSKIRERRAALKDANTSTTL
ncbi:hypothetical protein EDD22DRAFT_976678 [Suillus occidentalis]|nr:hypothetical protein EDD22DRAFT_976678 [Suillus occidentalis]